MTQHGRREPAGEPLRRELIPRAWVDARVGRAARYLRSARSIRNVVRFVEFPPELRRVVRATNAIESLNG
jgi:Transposase, Mutator family